MTPVRVLVDSFADKDLPNAQMGNAREIISRLDPAQFHVSVFVLGEPDTIIAQRPNTRLIPLPSHGQTPRIFREFAFGNYDVLFYLKSSPKPRPQLLFFGPFRPVRGPQLLLDAAAYFPDADFILAGAGAMEAELNSRVQRENLANVHLLGLLKADDLLCEYQKADIFLFPSSWEGSPKVILEAAACGLPVIARKNYQPETVIDGETGYLIGSDEELYSRLQELLRSPDLRKKLGRSGRKHAERFDWDLITRRWEEIFLELTLRKRFSSAA